LNDIREKRKGTHIMIYYTGVITILLSKPVSLKKFKIFMVLFSLEGFFE